MTDPTHAVDMVATAAEELVPQLSERLARYGLGEIEIADGELRLRVTAATGQEAAPSAAVTTGAAGGGEPVPAEAAAPAPEGIGVASPAVGFFVYADGLGPGLAVTKGDALGHVEMLGVRHDVRAPRAGTVRNLVAESGEAVEYGQVVVELEASAR